MSAQVSSSTSINRKQYSVFTRWPTKGLESAHSGFHISPNLHDSSSPLSSFYNNSDFTRWPTAQLESPFYIKNYLHKNEALDKQENCSDYRLAAYESKLVVPGLCTQLTGDALFVTLAMPMTDISYMWQKLVTNSLRWRGPISVGLLIINTTENALTSVDDVRTLIAARLLKYPMSVESTVCFHVVIRQVKIELCSHC